MIGKTDLVGDRDPGFEQSGEKFLRIADAGKGEDRPIADRSDHCGVGHEAGVEYGEASAFRGLDHGGRSLRRTDDDDRMRMFQLRRERRPQRSGRDHEAVADAAAAVDQNNRKVLGQGRILKAVIHDDHGRAVAMRGFGAGDAIAGHDGRREPRQKQRLVADGRRRMARSFDAHRSGQAPAIAAGQKIRPFVRGEQHAPDLDRSRGFAGAADRQVAETNHRYAGPTPGRAQAHCRRDAVGAGKKLEPPAAAVGIPPEGRFAHQGLILAAAIA